MARSAAIVAAFFVATLWATIETNYFGWNYLPGSPAELLCDGLAMLMVVIILCTCAVIARE